MRNALKSDEKLHQVVEALLRAGFVPDGVTAEERVRIPTRNSPLFGNTGGEARTFGGRARYTMPGQNVRVTVGARTVNVYTVDNGKTTFLANYKTRDLDIPTMLRVIADATGACTCSCHTRSDGTPTMDHEDCSDCGTWHRT